MFNFIVNFNPNSNSPLYEQLYKHIVDEIRNKNLKENEKLPSKKFLSKNIGISTNTVETAYSLLVSEGYIYSKPRSGFYVSRLNLPNFSPTASSKKVKKRITSKEKPTKKFAIDFKTNTVDLNTFPYSTWIKLSKDIMYSNPELLNSGLPQGDFDLRKSICEYLHEFRGVVCSPEQIVVGAGIEYLLSLLLSLFDKSSAFAIEDPGYKKISDILKNNGRDVIYIPVDEHGMRTDRLKNSSADIAYVSPSHQFPTGSIMPVGRRHELLHWAESKENRFIIEDDYNSEFNYSVRPIPAMQGLSDSNKVIYLSTFSRVLAPSIRIAYMVLPEALSHSFQKKFKLYSSTVPRFEQQTLKRFISEGYFSRHINRVKNAYKKRRDLLLSVLKPFNFEISGMNGGTHIVIKTIHAKKIIKAAEKEGIRLYDMGNHFHTYRNDTDQIIVGYAGVYDKDILYLGEVIKKALED